MDCSLHVPDVCCYAPLQMFIICCFILVQFIFLTSGKGLKMVCNMLDCGLFSDFLFSVD